MNTQPIEKSAPYTGHIQIHSIFDTIQGEGPFAGTPAVFLRLAGCNLQCPACDTDYTSIRTSYTEDGIVDRVKCYQNRKLVVLTGGEPLRQDIRPLVTQLKRAGYKVQIETNGTLYLPGLNQLDACLVLSPKTPKISEQWTSHPKWIAGWKYVIEEGKIADDGLPTSALGCPTPPARPPKKTKPEAIYVQPLDSGYEAQNRANLEVAVQTCLQHGYRLSVQIHKLVNLP